MPLAYIMLSIGECASPPLDLGVPESGSIVSALARAPSSDEGGALGAIRGLEIARPSTAAVGK